MTDERKVQIVERNGHVIERQEFVGDKPPPVKVPSWELAGGVVVIHTEPVSDA